MLGSLLPLTLVLKGHFLIISTLNTMYGGSERRDLADGAGFDLSVWTRAWTLPQTFLSELCPPGRGQVAWCLEGMKKQGSSLGTQQQLLGLLVSGLGIGTREGPSSLEISAEPQHKASISQPLHNFQRLLLAILHSERETEDLMMCC